MTAQVQRATRRFTVLIENEHGRRRTVDVTVAHNADPYNEAGWLIREGDGPEWEIVWMLEGHGRTMRAFQEAGA